MFRPGHLRLDGNGNPAAEEFHYSFDSTGRLTNAAFAQTPQSGQSGYTATYPAGTRARAYYSYDPAGRLNAIEHWWDTWNTGTLTYGSEAILGNGAAYELTGSNRGLKTSSTFYVKNPNNPAQFVQEWTETFGYDADLDYLTSASYTDGQPNASPTWSYDAAGNRNDATVVDNLNRATTIGGVSRTYDILGNTVTKGSSITYGWDALNRMTSLSAGSGNWTYAYRADGMRVSKSDGTTLSRFRYDGQMPVETLEVSGSAVTVTRNALGARGIDRIETVTSSGSSIAYPVYDGHGNMVATLAKSGSGYTVGNRRSFGAWGDVRQGATSGDPKGRYVANLGHQDDDESGMTYMRARYYEASSGRFVSEDPSGKGGNWYSYCANNPVSCVDQFGRFPVFLVGAIIGGLIAGLQQLAMSMASNDPPGMKFWKIVAATLVGAVGGAAACFGPGASAAAAAIGNFVQSVTQDLLNGNGFAGVNWRKARDAGLIGGVCGIAFAAIGAAWGRNLDVAQALRDPMEQLGGALGEFTGGAVGTAGGNLFYP